MTLSWQFWMNFREFDPFLGKLIENDLRRDGFAGHERSTNGKQFWGAFTRQKRRNCSDRNNNRSNNFWPFIREISGNGSDKKRHRSPNVGGTVRAVYILQHFRDRSWLSPHESVDQCISFKAHMLVKQYGYGRWIVTLSVAFAVQKEIKSIVSSSEAMWNQNMPGIKISWETKI